MSQFIRAHGADPGPTQRPISAGAITGAAAALPAIGLMWISTALRQQAYSVGLSHVWPVAPLQWLAFIIGAAIYGWIFGRAANDRRGGWLFGIGFGFLLWMLGPSCIVQWTIHHPLATGRPALGLLAAYLLFGLLLGLLFPTVHQALQRRLPDELMMNPPGVIQ